jgi:type II secretory pathway pseudopilin PulG
MHLPANRRSPGKTEIPSRCLITPIEGLLQICIGFQRGSSRPATPVRDENEKTKASERGFALVSILLLMALLTLAAVGFLSLSVISPCQAGNLDAQAQAKANARLAIMAALGELQRTLGKDTAVTASSDLTLPPGSGQRHLTGVWDSWPVPLGGSPNYSAEKDARFRGWLVSDTDQPAPAEPPTASPD